VTIDLWESYLQLEDPPGTSTAAAKALAREEAPGAATPAAPAGEDPPGAATPATPAREAMK
jgi:hypothetical protein